MALAAISHHIDYAADGIGAEAHRHHAAVHLDAIGEVDGYIVEPEGVTNAFLWHAVDEHLHMAAAEAVHRYGHIRAHTAALADFHAGGRC